MTVPGSVVASDLDADGDPDLLHFAYEGFPTAFVNDGAGQFERLDVGHSTLDLIDREATGIAAVDIDGDRLPEVFVVGPGFLAASRNLGGLAFAPLELLWSQPEYPLTCFNSVAFGDLDGDGDLDAVLPGLDPVPDAEHLPETIAPEHGSWGVLLRNDASAFTPIRQLGPGDEAGLSVLAAPTDRDGDGDLDLLMGSDRAFFGFPNTAFYRNDGNDADGPILVDDAPDVGADLPMSAMGIDGTDLNGDGDLDYCITDVADRLQCLLSTGDGTWAEGADSLGLSVDPARHPDWEGGQGYRWVGWSLELIDLDNDGLLDGAAAAGPPPDFGNVGLSDASAVQPDALWQGTDGGFVERGVELGFGDGAAHFGLATADLDADGTREIVIGTWQGPMSIWDNPCGEAAWLELSLDGPGSNRQALGARVELQAGGVSHLREVLGPRALGQSVPDLHFGLGELDVVDEVRIRWLDGEETVLNDVAVRQRLEVAHPAWD